MITKAVPSGPYRLWPPSFTTAPLTSCTQVPTIASSSGALISRGAFRGAAVLRARCPSGRPGSPLAARSSESRCLLNLRAPPGSHPPRPVAGGGPPAGRPSPPLGAGAEPELPAVVRRCGTPPRDPAAPGGCEQGLHVRRSVVDPAEPTWPPTALCQHPPHLRRLKERPGQRRRSAGKREPPRERPSGGLPRRTPKSLVRSDEHGPAADHGAQAHTGSGASGPRSGSPGVPERGSVDQRATRSSGACTTKSPVRQIAKSAGAPARGHRRRRGRWPASRPGCGR